MTPEVLVMAWGKGEGTSGGRREDARKRKGRHVVEVATPAPPPPPGPLAFRWARK